METHRRHLGNRSKVALRQDAVDARKLDIHLESDYEVQYMSAHCAAAFLSPCMPTVGVVLSVAPLDLVDEQALRGDTFVDVTEALHKRLCVSLRYQAGSVLGQTDLDDGVLIARLARQEADEPANSCSSQQQALATFEL